MKYLPIIQKVVMMAALAALLSSCGIRRHKYADPITKNTQQPDKVLFDRAIHDIEHSRYEIARLTLQTLINTYDSSEYLAKAKLAIADSWYREGGAHGLAQAEAEYKDFELFYPNMEEAAEAQERVCDIHYRQMEKPDRDPLHAIRAEDECRQLLLQYPNSKFAPETQQKLREVQEVLAAHEYAAALFYHHKGSFPAAANRLGGMVNQYPLFSHADDALWLLGDSYNRMGDRFEDRAADAYSRLVKEYPLSEHADAAKSKLEAMKRPVPEADPVAYARMKYELENHTNEKLVTRALDMFRTRPDTTGAAKSGTPTMTAMRPTIPASVPQVPGAAAPGANGSVTSDVAVSTVSDTKELDSRPDARANPPANAAAPSTPANVSSTAASGSPNTDASGNAHPAVATQQPYATNHPLSEKDRKRAMKKAQEAAKKKRKEEMKHHSAQPAAAQSDAQTQAQTPPPQK
ncbi:MAG TPA: outer membrane protein assembly factor BamD [Bryobacteraceae bacterium]|nr:outer membrane protein assembly factor BamD [Bryobacteraceae bacterium]